MPEFDSVSGLQQEQMEWDDVNKLLRHHGFKPVHFADPVENKNLPGERTTFLAKVKSVYLLKKKANKLAIGSKESQHTS